TVPGHPCAERSCYRSCNSRTSVQAAEDSLEPECRSEADFKLVQYPAIQDNRASTRADQLLELCLHDRRQIFNFDSETPVWRWKDLDATSDAHSKSNGASGRC